MNLNNLLTKNGNLPAMVGGGHKSNSSYNSIRYYL